MKNYDLPSICLPDDYPLALEKKLNQLIKMVRSQYSFQLMQIEINKSQKKSFDLINNLVIDELKTNNKIMELIQVKGFVQDRLLNCLNDQRVAYLDVLDFIDSLL